MLKRYITGVFCLFTFIAQANTANIELTIVAPELRPLIYTNKDGKVAGDIVESLKTVTEHSNLKINIEIIPWGRALEQVVRGDSDAIMPTIFTNQRAKVISYPNAPLINFNSSVIIKLAEDDFNFSNFNSIGKKRTIAKVRSVLLGKEFDESYKKGLLNIIEVSKIEDALNMLLFERVNLVVSDDIIARSAIDNMGIGDKVNRIYISKNQEPSYIAFSQKFSQKHDINHIMQIINQYNHPNNYLK